MKATERPPAVLVYPFTAAYHRARSRSREGHCDSSATGYDCKIRPEFTVVGDRFDAAACSHHLPTAVRRAAMTPSGRRRSSAGN